MSLERSFETVPSGEPQRLRPAGDVALSFRQFVRHRIKGQAAGRRVAT
jgi:hypothetical protein